MKKLLIASVCLVMVTKAFGQVTVPEPEFINSYCILTSDSTLAVLPKEVGQIKNRQNKVGKFARIAGGLSQAAGAAGILGMGAAGSMSGVVAGARVARAAVGVGGVVDAVEGLAGADGMDIVFNGASSTYTCSPGGQDVRLLIKADNNETDPMDCYRIVRFKTSKKDRSVKWMEFQSALIGSEETKKAGYVQFEGHKYGEKTYLLTIPASEIEEGEYGIVFMSIATAVAVPVGTFSVK